MGWAQRTRRRDRRLRTRLLYSERPIPKSPERVQSPIHCHSGIHSHPTTSPVPDMCLILIVDDHDDVRGALGAALRDAGHDVELATDGDAALSWLGANPGKPPCLIILDLRMPKMDGWDFLYDVSGKDCLRAPSGHRPVRAYQTGRSQAGPERASLLVKASRSWSTRKRPRALSHASPNLAARERTSLSPHRRLVDHRSKVRCRAFRLVGSLECVRWRAACATLSMRGG